MAGEQGARSVGKTGNTPGHGNNNSDVEDPDSDVTAVESDATIVASEDLLSSVLKSMDDPRDDIEPEIDLREAESPETASPEAASPGSVLDLPSLDEAGDADEVTLPPKSTPALLWQPKVRDAVPVAEGFERVDPASPRRVVPLAEPPEQQTLAPALSGQVESDQVESDETVQSAPQVDDRRQVAPKSSRARRVDPVFVIIGLLIVAATVLAYFYLAGR